MAFLITHFLTFKLPGGVRISYFLIFNLFSFKLLYTFSKGG
nr:MAG TPA: hypothetical protein [Caudoviricetes sp.]